MLLMAACLQIDARRRQQEQCLFCSAVSIRWNRISLISLPVSPRSPSECMVGVNCGKQKYCSGLDSSHTAAISLSTSSLQQTRLPLLQLICDNGCSYAVAAVTGGPVVFFFLL